MLFNSVHKLVERLKIHKKKKNQDKKELKIKRKLKKE